MCAAGSPIVSALLRQNVLLRGVSAIRGSTSVVRTRSKSKFHWQSRSFSSDAGAAVTGASASASAYAPDATHPAQISHPKTVSDYQELYQATKKKFQCKPQPVAGIFICVVRVQILLISERQLVVPFHAHILPSSDIFSQETARRCSSGRGVRLQRTGPERGAGVWLRL